jgi:hypothetical protein
MTCTPWVFLGKLGETVEKEYKKYKGEMVVIGQVILWIQDLLEALPE